MKKICIVSSSRAEFSLLKNLIIRIKNSKYLKYHLICTGTHLSKFYGETKKEIINHGIKIHSEFKIVQQFDSPYDISKSFSQAVLGFARIFRKNKFNCIVYLGDRYEILAAAYAALIFNIPKIHIHGGELTQGVIDDATRHSISKISNYHFVSHPKYKKRLIQLGENSKNINIVGAMGLENLKNIKKITNRKFYSKYSFKLNKNNKNILITLHPENLNKNITKVTINNLLKVLKSFNDYKLIFTYPNQDTFGRIIINKILEFTKKYNNSIFIKSLGNEFYFSLLKKCSCVIGNSSSGIIEVPSFKIPTVNIGDRQKGRLISRSVLNTNIKAGNIKKTINKSLNLDCSKVKNIYAINELPSKKIYNFLLKKNFSNDSLQKKFFDLKI